MMMMIGPIERFMISDHARIDDLMRRATFGDDVDVPAFEAFREALLRHIGMEEKILLPLIRANGRKWPNAERMHREHGEIARLLVPTPTLELCERICQALSQHNPIEEDEDGLYAVCDEIAGAEADRVVERLRAAPRVPLAKHYDGPLNR